MSRSYPEGEKAYEKEKCSEKASVGGQEIKKKIFVILLTFAVVMGAFAGLDMDARASEPCIFTADQNGTISCNYDYTNLIISAALNTEFTLQFNKPEWLKDANGSFMISSFTFSDGNGSSQKAIASGRVQSMNGHSSQPQDGGKGVCYITIENYKDTPYSGTTTITDPKWKISVKCTYDADSNKLEWDIVAELYGGSDPLSEPISEKADNTGGTGNGATEGQNDSSHTHSFEWTVTKEPTKTEDGLEEYKCKGCGAVEASQPISANMVKVKELYGLVKDAPKGGAVAYDFGDLSTISDYVLAKMAERNDVAVTVSFTYGGEAHSITFPAGTDYAAVLTDADAMYGFYGVAVKLGLTVE